MRRTITLEDIQKSPTLRGLGAMAGDEWLIDSKKLKRVFSEDKDAEGRIITAGDILKSPTLRKLGAEEGDKWLNKKLVPMKEHSAWQQFRYSIAKGEQEGITDYVTDTLTKNFPLTGTLVDYGLQQLGDILLPSNPLRENYFKPSSIKFESPDVKYGEGFSAADVGQRREMMLRQKERALQEEFGSSFKPKDGVVNTLGEIAGSVNDLTSLIPFGGGLKAASIGSAALGGSHSMLQDEVTTGEIDPVKALISTAVAGAAPAALGLLGKGVVKTYKGTQGLYVKKTAQKTVNKVQAGINKSILDGKPVTMDNFDEIAQSVGVSPKRAAASYDELKLKPRLNTSVEKAEAELQHALATDSTLLRTMSKGANNLLTVMNTQIRDESPEVFGKIARLEYESRKGISNYEKRTVDWVNGVSELPIGVKQRLNKFLRMGNDAAVEGILKSANASHLIEPFRQTQKVLKEIGEERSSVGLSADVGNYYPTIVKDYAGLRVDLDKPIQGKIKDALDRYATRKGIEPSELTDAQISKVTSEILSGRKVDKSSLRPTFNGERTLESVSANNMRHYANPEDALPQYIRKNVDAIEKRKFFGVGSKDSNVVDDVDGALDVSSSASLLLGKLANKGEIDVAQQAKLQSLIKSRMDGSDKMMHPNLAAVKNLGYMGTLVDVMSTITQAADVAPAAIYQGIMPTVKAIVDQVPLPAGLNAKAKANFTKLDDMHMEEVIAHEFGDPAKFTKALGTGLKWTGFKRIDKFGKEVLVNAVRNRYKGINKLNSKGENSSKHRLFKEDWGKVYGDRTDELLHDLSTGEVTELSKLHMFTELLGHQPIALGAYPPAYANSANGRIFYMLKSFTLMQWDLVRNNIYKDLKTAGANKDSARFKRAAGRLAGLGLIMSSANLGTQKTKDFMQGKDMRPEDLPTDAAWALAGALGFSKYSGEKFLSKGDVLGAGANLLKVPIPYAEHLQRAATLPLQKDPEKEANKLLKAIPVVGRMAYAWFGGGIEEAAKMDKRRRRAR